MPYLRRPRFFKKQAEDIVADQPLHEVGISHPIVNRPPQPWLFQPSQKRPASPFRWSRLARLASRPWRQADLSGCRCLWLSRHHLGCAVSVLLAPPSARQARQSEGVAGACHYQILRRRPADVPATVCVCVEVANDVDGVCMALHATVIRPIPSRVTPSLS